MKVTVFKLSTLFPSIVAVVVLASGCGQQRQTSEPAGGSTPVAETSHETDDPSHGGWWCVEHGIPEEQCSLCSSKAADECKAKGDWCEEHNRAESQCFICDASRAEKFANLYEAKVGTKPPQREDEE